MMDSATSRDTASAAQGSNPDSAAINIESRTDVAYSRSYVNFPDRDLCGPLGSSPTTQTIPISRESGTDRQPHYTTASHREPICGPTHSGTVREFTLPPDRSHRSGDYSLHPAARQFTLDHTAPTRKFTRVTQKHPNLTMTEKSAATTEPWFSHIVEHLASKWNGSTSG